MPTGQALAGALGLTPLTASQIEAAAGSPQQVDALQAGEFSGRTPLWFYILAEAAHPAFGNGQHLGPVGSTIVAEVLVGLAQRSKNSILNDPNWTGPTLPSAQPGTFELADLLRFARVLDEVTGVTCQYTVVAGDTLGGIAQRLYGDPNQWPRIFNANQDQISDPDQIFPGQVLRIPATDQYTVVAGDTLRRIAQQFYGDESQWPRIFEANRNQISDPNQIFPEQVLCIP
jgi:nucleoid-associated protein YgaU